MDKQRIKEASGVLDIFNEGEVQHCNLYQQGRSMTLDIRVCAKKFGYS